MEKNIKCIIFLNNLILVSEVVEIMNEIGEPDCKLINPYKVIKNNDDYILYFFPFNYIFFIWYNI